MALGGGGEGQGERGQRSRKQGRECGAGVVVVGEVGQRDGWWRCWSAWATRWLVPLVDALGFRADGWSGRSVKGCRCWP